MKVTGKKFYSAWALALCALLVAGCWSPAQQKRQADQQAMAIIDEKQQEALGRNEPFELDRPEDLLRRRLLIEQDLPVSGRASYGAEYLPRINKLPQHIEAGEEIPQEPPLPLEAVELTLIEALQVGARNNREYQTRKENVFVEALNLDFERYRFDFRFFGLVNADITTDLRGEDTTGVAVSPSIGFNKLFRTGAFITSRIGIDLARLLTGNGGSAMGIFADASVTVPLLRGAGVEVVTEPLQQAERNVIYAIWDFENYKRSFAVQVASQYLLVLQTLDAVENAEANYRRLIGSTRRARRLADAGRLPEIQVDQSIQQELRARDRWITARENLNRRLDSFKLLLGLPPDAYIVLSRDELSKLQPIAERVLASVQLPVELQDTISDTRPATDPELEQPPEEIQLVEPTFGPGGPLELPAERAVALALQHRLDLLTAHGRVFDAQRRIVVAADALGADLDLVGSASLGGRRGALSGGLDDAQLRLDEGVYSGGLRLDLPLDRVGERNAYRISLINLERAVRTAQNTEDQVKLEVLNSLRDLLEAGESLKIQARAVEVAQRRVNSVSLFLEAGRAQIRDLLEAEEALVTAQNALTQALVDYRITELELQRNLGVLEVDERGLWQEFDPTATNTQIQP